MFVSDPQQSPPESLPPSLADIVREETGDGRLIVRFLIDLMQGSLEDAKPCHRLDAARQLLNLGFFPAHAFIAANAPASQRQTPAPPTLQPAPAPLHQDLAALICEETGNGRTAVRFLVDVMQGSLQDFKPHHRLSAAKELLRRGFDAPAPQDNPGNFVPAPEHSADNFHPAEYPAKPSPYPGDSNRYRQEYGPFFFESYDEDDYRRDCFGDHALLHVLGSDQAISAATSAVLNYRSRADRFPLDSGQSTNPSPGWPAVASDAPLPEAIYGYNVLLYIYGSESAARVAAQAAYRYFRYCRTVNSPAGNDSDFPPRPPTQPAPQHPSPDPPQEHPPPSGSAPGPARISLDSLSANLYLYDDD